MHLNIASRIVIDCQPPQRRCDGAAELIFMLFSGFHHLRYLRYLFYSIRTAPSSAG
eukprot:SAG31_NODE_244_length_19246_cov_20.233823_13_plen_56_part_00